MKKERKVIDSNAIIVFDRTISATELNEALENFHGDVVIKGDLLLNDDLNVGCNLFVEGVIDACDKITSINIIGDLLVHATNCHKITVSGDLFCIEMKKKYCKVEIKSEDICVGGTLYCKGNIIAKNIEVGASLECENIKKYNHTLNIFVARNNIIIKMVDRKNAFRINY